MIKAFKRLIALFAGVLVAFGAIKTLFNWLARVVIIFLVLATLVLEKLGAGNQ